MQNPEPAATLLSLEEAQRRLRRCQRLLSCFQHVLGHDLPGRLVAIQGLIQLLQIEQQDHLDPEGREYLQRLAGLAQKVHQDVRSLAEVGRLIANPPLAESAPLEQHAREAVAEVNQLSRGQPIEYDITPDAAGACCRQPGFRHVLVRLLGYLARSAAETGRTARVDISARATDHSWEVRLHDPALTLPPERLPLLFEPFPTGAEGQQNLGLFAAQLLVDAWGGELVASSEPERGMAFLLTVPMREDE